MSNLIVVPNEVTGWDVLHEGDPQALTNHPDRETAIEAAKLRVEEEGEGEVIVRENRTHGIDDSTRGMKAYFLILLALLAAATIIIVVTALLANATGI